MFYQPPLAPPPPKPPPPNPPPKPPEEPPPKPPPDEPLPKPPVRPILLKIMMSRRLLPVRFPPFLPPRPFFFEVRAMKITIKIMIINRVR